MKICPKCGSKNIDWLVPYDGAVWECKDCNYTGPITEGNKLTANGINNNYNFRLNNRIFKK